jgi:hypothetical protein
MNASPLIYLTHIGLLEALNEPGVPVVVLIHTLRQAGFTMSGKLVERVLRTAGE